MAYTDYVNVAAPSNWDEPQSGVLPYSFFAGTQSLVDIKALRTDTIASKWNGTRYADVFQSMVFQFPAPVVAADIWVNQRDDNGYTGLWCYGTDDELLFGGPLSSLDFDPAIDIDDPENPGSLLSRVYNFTLPVATPVKAIVISDTNGFPQGSPGQLYGIYGTILAGDPPPPPPFWTGFTKTFEVA